MVTLAVGARAAAAHPDDPTAAAWTAMLAMFVAAWDDDARARGAR